ncbi:hypothetical protein TVAG_249610 [Trichomonas vaginalis G3]|uniref:Longin domain-containing protein n=1 Tax=Trichomonas vaginalis (strain ATCC PRA-98 / G3) TaxID=412133 RepID=A2DCG4_TRIV3|nr:longin domain domain-containing protein [Trichomonas vaginalis G3]EAY21901.1 hypothetical protein TVAG_249610 [Trichomonas vaginalis G3]KAI5487623.1 longin domain domain-containing protein [Trichomonas vaginalis G3]|eukprot:XP_001582887.1 hypothetical protein [Trichomonas vaginalis G3]
MVEEIAYIGISNGPKILLQCTYDNGDFDYVIHNVLKNLSIQHEKSKFIKSDFMYFLLHSENNLNIFLVAEKDFSETIGFKILEDIRSDILRLYANSWMEMEEYQLQHEYEKEVAHIIKKNTSKTSEIVQDINMEELEHEIHNDPMEYTNYSYNEPPSCRKILDDIKHWIIANWCEIIGGILLLILFFLLVTLIFWH